MIGAHASVEMRFIWTLFFELTFTVKAFAKLLLLGFYDNLGKCL